MTHVARTPAAPSPDGGDFRFWRDHTHISLQPVAAPSVLGLYGFAAATFIVGANLAGWYGNTGTPVFLFPFAAMTGGLAQLLAGMWAYRARDTLATAMHGIWGAFWLAYGLLFLLVAVHVLTPPTPFVPLGYWFIALAAITWAGAFAAMSQNAGLAALLAALALGSSLAAAGFISGSTTWVRLAGWAFVISAALGWYVATALLLEATYKRVILPLGRVGGANTPGESPRQVIQYRAGEPGVKVGQ
ncbi:acetate uptake transporter family protein [Rhizomonospora bruguierae]|uniref:acetate uptake transporter family protein n=1 Tax=Rhizomonospora bruguierae TaxID=1581705 RepID=UPI001BD129BA|nr:GPR1/FUN34/YaaH family transporter [Micromonospora sp. NBRC 107566]